MSHWEGFILKLTLFLFFFIVTVPLYFPQSQNVWASKKQTIDKRQKKQISLTKGEKAFLQAHPVIQIGTDKSWAPYVLEKADGELEGLDIDFIRYINKISGANIQLVTGHWAEIVEKAKDHKIDGLATSAPLKTRKPFFNFSRTYVNEFSIFIIPSDKTMEIKKIGDLSGKRIAVQKGNEFYESLLAPHQSIKVIFAESERESIKLMLEGKADVSIVSTSTYYSHKKTFLNAIKIGFVEIEKSLKIVYSIRKDWPELVSIINKSLIMMPIERSDDIYFKWFRIPAPGMKSEKKNEIQTIIVDNYYPYTFVNKNGQPDGFSVNLAKVVAHVMGLEIQIAVDVWDKAVDKLNKGEIDFLPMMAYSKERDKLFDFSVPHTIAYDAFFTRKDSTQITSIKDLKGINIIVMEGDQAHDYLASIDFIEPDNLIFINSIPDALRSLASGKGDAALMPKLVGIVKRNELNLTNLESSPIVIEAYNRPFSFAVKEGHQLLLERFGQGLSIVKNTGQYNIIYEKWFGAIEPKERSLKDVLNYIIALILLFILIGGLLMLWSLSMRKQVALRTKKLEEEIIEREQTEKALRNSEDRFRAAFDSASDCVLIWDKDYNYLYANRAAIDHVGTIPDQVIGKNIRDGLGHVPDFMYLWMSRVDKVFKSGERMRVQDEQEMQGHLYYTDSILFPIRGTESDVISVCVVYRDVTELKLAEEQIKASLKEKETLLSEIHHRVKNNMQVIISLLKLQAENIKDKKYADMFKESHDRIKSMALVHEKLYQADSFANIDLKGYVKSLVTSLFRSYGTRQDKITLKIEVEDVSLGLESAIPCGLIINELVSNALKYAFPEEKGGEIRVALNSINKDEILLEVSDNGVGISKELDIRNTKSMGLHLVTILSENQLEGEIELSRVDGTNFHIRFKKRV